MPDSAMFAISGVLDYCSGAAPQGRRDRSTDELGYQAVGGRMHLRDCHEAILHLLGLDNERLDLRHTGHEVRLTDVAGLVMEKVIA